MLGIYYIRGTSHLDSHCHPNNFINLGLMISTPQMTTAKDIQPKQDFWHGEEGFITIWSLSFDVQVRLWHFEEYVFTPMVIWKSGLLRFNLWIT